MTPRIMMSLLLLAVACGDPEPHVRTEREFLATDADRAARFVIDCAAAGNPKSDEEGEDLVWQCERTARALFGVTRWSVSIAAYQYIPCETADGPRLVACRRAGWKP